VAGPPSSKKTTWPAIVRVAFKDMDPTEMRGMANDGCKKTLSLFLNVIVLHEDS
jgi:hypothetical protein